MRRLRRGGPVPQVFSLKSGSSMNVRDTRPMPQQLLVSQIAPDRMLLHGDKGVWTWHAGPANPTSHVHTGGDAPPDAAAHWPLPPQMAPPASVGHSNWHLVPVILHPRDE